jgi:predicted O-methyltransferase YrrM
MDHDVAAEPPLVAAAVGRARRAGFLMSCEPAVGRLLAVLAAALPGGARVLELGTGTGVGTGWIISGLLPRTDVSVLTVESNPATAGLARGGDWPGFAEFRTGDALEVLAAESQAGRGAFDLVFADAPAGKWHGLDQVIGALRPHGLLVVDDMAPQPDWAEDHRALTGRTRRALLDAPELTCVEIAHGSGVILGARR